MRKFSKKILMMLIMLVTLFGGQVAIPQKTEAASANGQDIVNDAMQYVGKVPYVYGGNSLTTGADCSGFICCIYEHFGFNLWPHRAKLRNAGTNIGTDLSKARPGDIIWFPGHVGIYAGVENGHYMMVNETTTGNVNNVVYTKVSDCKLDINGIIQIPGVNGISVTPTVSFSEPTNATYVNKQTVSETNAVVVSQITKTSGLTCTKMGIQLFDGNYNLIKDYYENVSNVTASQTTFHSWFDMNAELKVTLTKATTYIYRFYGVFSQNTYYGDYRSFTTTGTVETHVVHFDANGGTGAPADQIKTYGALLTLLDTVPTRKAGTITFNANGGTAERDEQSDEYIFNRWSTSNVWGNGDTYYPGGSYGLDQDITMYAEWYLKGIGELPTATRNGYIFKGWKTEGGDFIAPTTTVANDMTVYAVWEPQGWVKENQNWYYYTQGKKATGWKAIGNTWYYFGTDGVMATGWLKQGSSWYYLKTSGAMTKGWSQIGSKRYYFNTSGAMQLNKWMTLDSKKYYLGAGGTVTVGWSEIGGSWYYFGTDGAMLTGWTKVGSSWYYLNIDGTMVTGWLQKGNSWYYLKSGGAATIGWSKIGNVWYYFGADAVMAIGWTKVGNSWYYMNGSGVMTTGWQKVGNSWYYMNRSGVMTTGWQRIGNSWYFMNSSGVMVTGDRVIDGVTYHFNSSGVWMN